MLQKLSALARSGIDDHELISEGDTLEDGDEDIMLLGTTPQVCLTPLSIPNFALGEQLGN